MKKDRWTIQVSDDEIASAKAGNWSIVLTPVKPKPRKWFPPLNNLKVLGLAAGGGQQCPILAAAGAQVTVFDNSPGQLGQDKEMSDRHALNIKTVQGDMRDLSVFEDDYFDLIFNPCSVLFVNDAVVVWKECFRVLKPGGILMAGLINPLAFQLDETSLHLIHRQPYSDLYSLPEDKLHEQIAKQEPLTFGHSLTDQIAGQLKAGFMLTDFYEDDWGGQSRLDNYFPSFFATKAVKPEQLTGKSYS